MGGAHSREGVLSDSDSDTDTDTEPETSIDSKLQSLSLNPKPNSNLNAVKLYRYVKGTSPSATWQLADKLTSFSFTRPSSDKWHLSIDPHIQTLISSNLQLKPSPDHLRCDFVADAAVWALKFPSRDSFNLFLSGYESCLFENTHGLDLTDDNKARVFGKDFAGWANPEKADDSIWEDAMDVFETENLKVRRDLLEEFEEAASDEGGKIQSLALGALDNSFLVGDSCVQVVRNFSHGVHGKGMSVKFLGNPKKALLMKAESNLLLMSPENRERVRQLDIETGKIVTEWRFEKDGTDITMRDIVNDSKGAQLDPSESTFLGLDDSRLCRWDMREKKGIVQDMTSSPVLEWTQGHQFARGTNFQCFASAGDGSIVVGSLDGKIRLYSKNSMRMAKTAFPGLGSPITYVDVTYDGKWVLGTTDTYLLLISTVFKDKDGKEKTGFSGRMGNRIAAPRMLKLTPLDAHLAGKDNKFHGGQFSWVRFCVFVVFDR